MRAHNQETVSMSWLWTVWATVVCAHATAHSPRLRTAADKTEVMLGVTIFDHAPTLSDTERLILVKDFNKVYSVP